MSKVKESMTFDYSHLRDEFEAAGLISVGAGMDEMRHIVAHGQEIACELFDALNDYIMRRVDADKCVHVEAYMLGAAFLVGKLLPKSLGADAGLPSPDACLELVSKFKEVASSIVVVDDDDDAGDEDEGENTPQIH